MATIERLNLVTNAVDNASPTLTKLGGLLETVGQQAERLNPIRIRVRVHDGELRNLQRRLAQTRSQQVMRTGFTRSPGDGGPHTFREGFASRMQRNIENIADTFDDIEPDISGTATGAGLGMAAASSGADLTKIAHLLEQQNDLLSTPGGGGGGGDPDTGDAALTAMAATDIADQLGVSEAMVRGRMFSPAAIAQGEMPFQLPTDFVGDRFDTRAFMRALDVDGLLAQTGVSDITQLDFSTLQDNIDGVTDSFFDLRDTEFFSRRRFRISRVFNTLSDLRIGMTDFYDILAALIPVLITFVGTLPLVISGLVGLGTAALGAAGVLASIAGLGLLGAAIDEAGGDVPGLEDIRDVFDGVFEDFVDAFADEASDLAPLFRDGVSALDRFFNRLASVAAMLPSMSDDARAFGRFAEEFVVGALTNLIQLANASTPIFEQMAAFLREADIIDGFAQALQRALPLLSHLFNLVVSSTDGLLRFAEGMGEFLSVSSSVLVTFASLITSIYELIPGIQDGNRFAGRLIGTLLSLVSVLLLATRVTSAYKTITKILGGTINEQVIVPLIKHIKTLGTKIGVTKYAAAANAKLAKSFGFLSAGTLKALGALKLLLLKLGIVGALLITINWAVGLLSDQFLDLSSDIDEATSSLEELQRQHDSMLSGQGAFVGALDSDVYVDYSVENRNDFQSMDIDEVQFATAGNTDSFVDTSRNGNSQFDF